MSDDLENSPFVPGGKNFCFVISDYTAKHRDEMSLAVNDVIEVTLLLDDGWLMGKNIFDDSQCGCFPSNHVRVIASPSSKKPTFCQALYDYDATTEDELSLIAGDYIAILKTDVDSGWMKGGSLSSREEGCFPVNFVRFLTDAEAEGLHYNEAGKEHLLDDPTINVKDNERYTKETSFELENEEGDKDFLGDVSIESNIDGHDIGNVEELGDSLLDLSMSSKNDSNRDEREKENVFQSTSEVNGGGFKHRTNDDAVSGNKAATPQSSANENMIRFMQLQSNKGTPRFPSTGNPFQPMQRQALGDKSFVLQDIQPRSSVSETSTKKGETSKIDQVVQQTGGPQEHESVPGFASSVPYTNPLIFRVVNDPAVLDYEYHIEEDENDTRPGCKTFTATVKWTVKSER